MAHQVGTKASPLSSEEKIFEDPVNRRLLEAAMSFSHYLTRLGYSVQAYSESTLQKMTDVPISKKEQITSNFESWCQWIEPLDPRESYNNEISLLLRALDKHGFEADKEFLGQIEEDQIIEFYNENMIQLYRSFNFYKITGYSLLDISLFEWYVLWDRPRQAIESIAAEIKESLETYIPVKPFKTKKHVVREIFSSSTCFKPRAALLTPICLGSLKPKKFGATSKKGFICTSRGEMIAVGKEAENIQFL